MEITVLEQSCLPFLPEEHDLSDHGIVGHHHGHCAEQGLCVCTCARIKRNGTCQRAVSLPISKKALDMWLPLPPQVLHSTATHLEVVRQL